MKSTLAFMILILAALLSHPAWCEIIPGNRTAPWQGNVGVPGGIPTRTTIWKNIVTDLGADPTGHVDAAPIINVALASCPANQVVYMPAGTFKIATPISVIAKSNYTLRGAGQGQTILHITTNNVPIYTAGTGPWPPADDWVPITSGATRGSNTITLSNTSNFAVDMLFTIGPNVLPTWAHNLGGHPDTDRTMGGMFKVRSKTATTITFDPPLPFDFSGMNPMALASRAVTIQGVGHESYTVDLADSDAVWGLQISSAWGCWVKDVEITGAYGRIMYFSEAVRCEIRKCHTHDVRSTGSNHEAIDFGESCSWNLVEDNICRTPGPPIVFGDAGGHCTGNVVAYNYIDNPENGGWDITFNHGPHNMLNLAEGNILTNYKDDGYFGSSSHNTLFRNRITHWLELKHFSNYYNIVGNVLGTIGFSNAYETTTVNYSNNPIYALGYPNIGNHNYVGTFGPTTPPDYSANGPNLTDPENQMLDLNVRATILRHGNFDYFNNATVWDAIIPDHTIPDSLYLAARPGWWPNAMPWPPIGPDLAPRVGQIPAQCRFLGGNCSPPGGPRTDFNGDGKPDYVLCNASTQQTAVWYLNNNLYLGGAFTPTLPAGWIVVSAADFNRDGHPDYALFRPSTRQTVIWYFSGVTRIGSTYGPTPPGGWALVATGGDFNNDGKPDYVLYNASTRQTVVWYLNNNVHIGGAYGPTLPAGWTLVGVADFNGDGKSDYLLFNATTRQTAIFYLAGTTWIGTASGPTPPAGWSVVGVVDFNRDGKPDYLLFKATTRQTVIWYMNNNVRIGGAYGPTLPAGWTVAAP